MFSLISHLLFLQLLNQAKILARVQSITFIRILAVLVPCIAVIRIAALASYAWLKVETEWFSSTRFDEPLNKYDTPTTKI